MKICMIKASVPGPYKTYKQQRGGPPQNIFSLAAATDESHSVELIDETAGMGGAIHTKADLVVIMMSTPDAPHAYALADSLRGRGMPVVLGGLHTTFMPEEALEHADAVILGEAELVWNDVLEDASRGSLQPRYVASEPVDLATLNPYPTNLIGQQVYNGFWSVLVSRGCAFNCTFCLVHRFFNGIRYRPVQAVVDEIRRSGANWIELHADNLTFDREYALELFAALKPLQINWVGETTIRIAEDEELLSLAAESGLRYLLVGLETPSEKALQGASKGFVRPSDAKEYVARLHDHRIIVDSSMLFGFEEHDPRIFEQALDFVEYVGIDISDGIIAIPFPGSRLFQDLDAEGRILTRDWSKYDGTHAVYRPAQMTPEQLEEGAMWFNSSYYSLARITRRKLRQISNIGIDNTAYLGLR